MSYQKMLTQECNNEKEYRILAKVLVRHVYRPKIRHCTHKHAKGTNNFTFSA